MLERIGQWEKSWKNMAYLYAAIGQTSLVFMQIFMKLLTLKFHPFYIIFMRSFFLIIINTLVMNWKKVSILEPRISVWSILLKRSLFSSVTLVMFLSSISYISISIANSLYNLSPIFAHFLEVCMLNKSIKWIHLILTLVCFSGVVLIFKPTFWFADQEGGEYKWLYLFPIIAAFTHSLSFIYLHQLSGKLINLVPIHYFYIFTAFISGVLQCFKSEVVFLENLTWKEGLFFVGLVAFSYLAQNANSKAVYLKKPSSILPFGYLTIIGTFFSDIFLFSSSFDFLSILGIILTSSALLTKLFI